MQYSQEHLKTMVYAEFGAQTECVMGNWKIENYPGQLSRVSLFQAFSFCGQPKRCEKKLKTAWVEPSKGKFPPLSTSRSLFFFPAALTLCRIPNFKRLEQARAESVASSIYKHLSENSQSSTLVQRSIAPLHKSRRNHRFYV